MEEGRITPPYGTEATQSSERRNSNLSYSSTRSRDRNRRQIQMGNLDCFVALQLKQSNETIIKVILFGGLQTCMTLLLRGAHCLKITQYVAFEFFNFGVFHQFLSS